MRDFEETNDESKERVRDGMAAKKSHARQSLCSAGWVQVLLGESAQV